MRIFFGVDLAAQVLDPAMHIGRAVVARPVVLDRNGHAQVLRNHQDLHVIDIAALGVLDVAGVHEGVGVVAIAAALGKKEGRAIGPGAQGGGAQQAEGGAAQVVGNRAHFIDPLHCAPFAAHETGAAQASGRRARAAPPRWRRPPPASRSEASEGGRRRSDTGGCFTSETSGSRGCRRRRPATARPPTRYRLAGDSSSAGAAAGSRCPPAGRWFSSQSR